MLDVTSIAALAPGRGAIITGGASGIGLATARQLGLLACACALSIVTAMRLRETREDLANVTRGAADILAQEADVSLPADLERVTDQAFERFDDMLFDE